MIGEILVALFAILCGILLIIVAPNFLFVFSIAGFILLWMWFTEPKYYANNANSYEKKFAFLPTKTTTNWIFLKSYYLRITPIDYKVTTTKITKEEYLILKLKGKE